MKVGEMLMLDFMFKQKSSYVMGISDGISNVCSSDPRDLVIINSAWCGYACKTPALRPAPPACCANDQIGGKLFGPSFERRDDHQFASAPRVPTTIYRADPAARRLDERARDGGGGAVGLGQRHQRLADLQ